MDYQLLKKKLLEKGIKITDDMIDKLDRYATLLVEKNNEFNLTAITKKEVHNLLNNEVLYLHLVVFHLNN
jgi:16S rRNA G527 N7-methylase RsmG